MIISIIMPVYNMKDCVLDAIKSWERQSITEKELICVDDGSTDGSLEILRACSKRNQNIIVHSLKENKGAGFARNIGISIASGKYIGFLDADDEYITDNAIELMVQYAELKRTDIIGGFVTNIYSDGRKKYPRFRDMFETDELYCMPITYSEIGDDYYFQGFIFNREVFYKYNIRFPQYKRNQDPPFLSKLLFNVSIINVINVEYYGHRADYKIIEYDLEKITDLLSGLEDDIVFSVENKWNLLFEKTIERINIEYFPQLLKGIRYCDSKFMTKLLNIYSIAKKNGYHIDVLEYLFYVERNSNKYNDYLPYRRLYNALRGEKIVIYGAGERGKKLYFDLVMGNYYTVVNWIDRYKSNEIIQGVKIKGIESLENTEYDSIIVSIDNKELCREVASDLVDRKVEKETIFLWCDYM